MRFMRFLSMLFVIVLMSSCTSSYNVRSVNNIQIGWSKAQFLRFYPRGTYFLAPEPPILRASQEQEDGQLVEVFSIPLMLPNYSSVDYWFVFRGNRLVQWGRPEDWQQVSGRYEILFNPSASVR